MMSEGERSVLGPALDVGPRGRRFSTIWLLAFLAVLALIPLLFFLRRIVQSDYLALAVSTPDDSFYYLVPAWRFKTSGFFTFDGIHSTYGFQPLFMVLLTGLSALLGSVEAVFRSALVINVILHVATGVVVGLIVNTVLSECSAMVRYSASLLAGAVYLLGSNLFWINLTLKENSLATFLYVLAIFGLLRAVSTRQPRSTSSDVWLGTLIGLLILTRLLPSSLLASSVMLGIVWVCLPRRSAIIITAATLVPLLVWGSYAKLAFGHLVPSSVRLKAGGAGALGAMHHWWSAGFADMFAWIGWYVGWAVSLLSDKDVTRWQFLLRAGFLAIGVSGLAVCTTLRAWWSRCRTTIVLLTAASLAGVVAIPALGYTTTRQMLTYATWYLFDVSAILAIAAAAAVGFLGQRGIARLPARWADPRPTVAAIVIAMISVGAVVTEIRAYRNVPIVKWEHSGCAGRHVPCGVVPESNWYRVRANFALRFRSVVPLAEGERVGAFNAGLVALLLLPTALVNLDGLANDDISMLLLPTELVNLDSLTGRVGAWPSATLAQYILRERIRYVIDREPPWTEWESVVGLKTELIMKMEPDHTSLEGDPLPYYVVRFLGPFPARATQP